jgi:hypothetical protein
MRIATPVLIKILERECLEKGVEIQYQALIDRLVCVRGGSPVVYEVRYIRTGVRILPGSESEAANDFNTNSEQTAIDQLDSPSHSSLSPDGFIKKRHPPLPVYSAP